MHKGVLGHLTMMEHHMSAISIPCRLKAAIEPLFRRVDRGPEKNRRSRHGAHHGCCMSMGMGMGEWTMAAAWEAWISDGH